MEYIKAKTILSKVKYGNEWYGIDYNMNLYRGCPHGCIYCDSRSNCYNIDNFDIPKMKENALGILEYELSRKKAKGIIGIGSMSDTYNPLEIKYEQTRGALKLISKYNYGVSIDTKSDLILRDIDILKEINSKNNVIIKFTITTPKDELSKIIEPNVCVSSKRFKAIKELSSNGIYTGIMLNPILPFITDNEDDIKDNQRDYYFQKLDKYFNGLKEKYIKYYDNKYICPVPNYKYLYKVLTTECDKYGILYNMKDIINNYKKDINTNEQISLF